MYSYASYRTESSSRSNELHSGLHYYGYRYYDASVGRWINRDPIEEMGGINLYGFVGNDPVRHVDVFGQFKLDTPYRILGWRASALVNAMYRVSMKVCCPENVSIGGVGADGIGGGEGDDDSKDEAELLPVPNAANLPIKNGKLFRVKTTKLVHAKAEISIPFNFIGNEAYTKALGDGVVLFATNASRRAKSLAVYLASKLVLHRAKSAAFEDAELVIPLECKVISRSAKKIFGTPTVNPSKYVSKL